MIGKMELCYLFVFFCLLMVSFAEEIGSPLKVAQCRATCVHMFTKKTEAFSLCLNKKDCLSCWKSCQQLQTSFNKLCSQNVNCGAGCEAACKFMDSGTAAQRAPVSVRHGKEVLKIKGLETRWPAPAPKMEGPWVYLVMRRLNNAWRQITQTLDLSANVPPGGMIRVLVVGKDGLVTIYGPAEEDQRMVVDKGWHLREVSVIHQESVIIAEVAWEARHPRALYLVTWEVDGGGLRGNLLTSSTCAALSLWPDTVFHVQVELMNPGNIQTEKSNELIIDTHKGKEEGIILPEESNQSKEDDVISVTSSSNVDNETSIDDTNPELLGFDNQVQQHLVTGEILVEFTPTQHQIEIIAGIGAAFAVFLIVLIWRWRNRLVVSSHVKLVEDETIQNPDHFKVVTHNPISHQQIVVPLPQDAVT